MAPMNGAKRGRSRADTEEFADDSGYAEASSNLRQRNSGHKRPRLSKPDDSDDDASIQSSTLDDSGDENASMARGANRHDTSDVEYDEESEDDYDPDISDEEALRRYMDHRRSRGINVVNHPAMLAIIEEITCTNFMCHSHLTIGIGPLINFIIGHNGSGKSAVLTALQICLGGRAGASNRGGSLKDLIKVGTERATLLVKIKNRGELAYLPDLYGQSIIVERHFTRSGTSGFSIRNANGKQVSTRKSDLDDILDALALQLDNPMNVLTQDKAREFLNSSSASDKYKFFIKGTHLEQLDTDYKVLSDSLERNNQAMYNIQESRATLVKAVEKAAEKVKQAEKTDALHERAKHVRRQYIWSQVRDQEEALAAVEEDIRAAQENVQNREQASEQIAAKYEQAEQARDAALQTVQQLKDAMEPKQQERTQVAELEKSNSTEMVGHQAQARENHSELSTAKKKVSDLKNLIEAENEKLANAEDGRHGEQLAEIQTAEDEVVQLKERHQAHSANQQQLQQALSRAQENERRARPAVSEAKSSVNACESTIRTLTNSRRSWQDGFHNSLPALLKAIEQNRSQFRELPVGPLGRHVALLRPEWSSVLEKGFGKTLDGFAVTSVPDQQLLTLLMSRVGYPVNTFMGNSARIPHLNEPPAELVTWLRVLKIDSQLALNTFIVNQGIDQAVLIPSREEAAKMAMGGPRNNIRQIFAINNRGGGYRFAWTMAKNQTQSPIEGWRGSTRMQTDTESRVAMERQNLANLKQDLDQAERALREAGNQVKIAQQALNTHSREAKDFVVQIQRQEEKVSRLRDQLEEATPQTGLLDSYREELKTAESEAEILGNQFVDFHNEKRRLRARATELKNQLDEIDRELQSAEEEVNRAQHRHDRLEKKRYDILLEKNKAHHAVEDAQNTLQRHQGRREQAQEEVQTFIAKASEDCERVPLDRGKTSADFENEYKVLQRTIDKAKDANGGSHEELAERLAAIQAEFNQKDLDYQEVSLTLKRLAGTLITRQDRWQKFRKYMSINAKSAFSFLLSERNFRGKLKVDHDNKLLDMTIEPDKNTESAKGRQTTTLSGGEKSFSTICLLLSIWEAMGSPIRCLDEFDVFMDQVNRDVSMKMLIDTARSSTSRQFIFITPQAMNNVVLGTDVKIHKMRDPDRDTGHVQTTLGGYGRA